jgi:hypothetical protein
MGSAVEDCERVEPVDGVERSETESVQLRYAGVLDNATPRRDF